MSINFNLHPKQTFVLETEATEILYGGAAGGGKDLYINTLVPVPLSTDSTGFKKHGDLKIGDEVYNPNGNPVKVIYRHPDVIGGKAYEVEFDTGEIIIAGSEHLWQTWTDKARSRLWRSSEEFRSNRRATRSSRAKEILTKPWVSISLTQRNKDKVHNIAPAAPAIVSTESILNTLTVRKSARLNHSIEIIKPISGEDVVLPVNPYLYGVWLGDGFTKNSAIGMMVDDFHEIEKYLPAHTREKVKETPGKKPFSMRRYKELNLRPFKNEKKKISIEYLRASKEQRLELLRGLMDTDGTCDKRGRCEVGFSNKELSDDVLHLINSLGIKCSQRTKLMKSAKHNTHYRMKFIADVPVFKLPRKLERQKNIIRQTANRRYIKAVRPAQPTITNCITVEGGLYCIGETFITTHNSHLLRVIGVILGLYIPNIQIYLFRRLSPDLFTNHMDGESGFRNMLAPLTLNGDVRIVEDEIRFKNGAKIHLCHCQYEKDRFKYQGAEIHVLLIDELTHFTDVIYRFLRNRVRMPPTIPKIIYDIFGADFTLPKIICGSNPGNVGHTFVKQTFVDMLKPFEVKKMPPEEGGMLRQYIPALLEDNPSLMLNDPGYEQRLEGLGSPDLVKAMRYGLWDITAGAALEKLRRDKHMIRDFQVPQTWTKFMVIDWGSAKPFAVGWFCVVDDDLILKAKGEWVERLIPRGALILYREWYGWNGKANEGCRLESPTVAKQIMDIEEEAGEEMDYRVGDSAMWAEHDGKSIQERMYDATEGRFIMERSKKDRINNYEEIRTRVAGDDDGPMFYATVGCKHFWRTVPDLQLDDRRPELGPESSQEDHCVIAGTKVITEYGLIEIQNIKTNTKVLTTEGFMPCIQLGQTSVQDTYKIKINNIEYEATGNHPFLTEEGVYVRLDALCQAQKLYQIQSSFSLAKAIGYVVSIINAAVLDCIVRFGNFTMGIYQRVIKCITKITIDPIMQLRILNLSLPVHICPYIPESQKQESIKRNKSNLCKIKPWSGINQKKERSFINGLVVDRKQLNTKNIVSYVIKSLWQSLKSLYSAGLVVQRSTGGVPIQTIILAGKEQNVYNLHIPTVNNFVLEGGIVVHNCYDIISYGCASRPYITTRRERLQTAIKEAKRQARKNS